MYKYVDYTEEYDRIMQFGKNKSTPVHRWYPFVEGYSKEFIQSIVEEQKYIPEKCLDPFSGSGTTSLELQQTGIHCIAFEVNPFMYTLSKTKINSPKYQPSEILKHIDIMQSFIENVLNPSISFETQFNTLIEGKNKKKWNLNKTVYIAIEKIKLAISSIENNIYEDLYTIALASLLPDISNVYRNGKCLSYKNNWEENKYKQSVIFKQFFDILIKKFVPDLQNLKFNRTVDNSENIYCGDCLGLIHDKIEDNSIDLVITSPPYLNSRDYTDSYMLELRTLGYVKNHQEVKNLRNKTLKSHVQIKYGNDIDNNNTLVQRTIRKIDEKSYGIEKWNNQIPMMIKSYFNDIEDLFNGLYSKIKPGGKIYFNVSNSAYYNVLVNTLNISANIAESCGFDVLEIRKARYLKSSPQQKDEIKNLLEGIIVLEK